MYAVLGRKNLDTPLNVPQADSASSEEDVVQLIPSIPACADVCLLLLPQGQGKTEQEDWRQDSQA